MKLPKLMRGTGYNVLIYVDQLVPDSELDSEDYYEKPEEVYNFFVQAKSPRTAKKIALDNFHETIPISCLDHWDIQAVIQGEARWGPKNKEILI